MKLRRRLRYNRKRTFTFIFLFLMVLGITLGYAFLTTSLNVNGALEVSSSSWDIHFANIIEDQNGVEATTAPTVSNNTTITFAVDLEKATDFYSFTADIINDGTYDAKIDSITITPTLTTEQQNFFKYEVTYSDGTQIQTNDALDSGTSENIKVYLEYKENAETYLYQEEDEELEFSVTITYVQGKGNEVVHPSFATDSWATIINNIQNNTIPSYYTVGSTKEVDMGTFGTHTLRIANTTTPSECNTTGFSQAACGFVLEFADIITTHRMNPYTDGTTNGDGNKGSWEYSEMRTYVNTDIYNALPTDLRNGIINTTVVSGHGSVDTTNYTTTDKLYLLDAKEIYGTSFTSTYDTSKDSERQLDYYLAQGVTTSSYSGASKQYNGSNDYWWLRSAYSDLTGSFFRVSSYGRWNIYNATDTSGVAPAFRLG